MKFDHAANRVALKHFDIFIEMMKSNLNFVELRRAEGCVWLRQPGKNVDLQFCHSPTINRDADKNLSQVAFLSDTPKAELEKLASWAKEHGMVATVGSYSDKEFYLDIKDAFIDFVIEAMTPDLADYTD